MGTRKKCSVSHSTGKRVVLLQQHHRWGSCTPRKAWPTQIIKWIWRINCSRVAVPERSTRNLVANGSAAAPYAKQPAREKCHEGNMKAIKTIFANSPSERLWYLGYSLHQTSCANFKLCATCVVTCINCSKKIKELVAYCEFQVGCQRPLEIGVS